MYCDWPRLGRCCFCMPLRRGVLTCAYINLFFSAFMLGLYSYTVHYALRTKLMVVLPSVSIMPNEMCIVLLCFELVFNAVLIYGAHKKLLKYVQIFYHYTLVTFVAVLLLQIVDILSASAPRNIEKSIIAFSGDCIQIYLIILVRSLVENLKESGPHTYENQLHPIANGELNVESSGVYNNTTAIPLDA